MTNKFGGFSFPGNGHSPSLSNGHGGALRMPAGLAEASVSFRDRGHAAPASAGVRTATSSDHSVGQEIRSLRRSQGRTQKELARVIGVTGAQLHRYETGSTRIAASRLIAIANALGVGAETLITAGASPAAPAAAPHAAPATVVESDDIVELIELFVSITDRRHRSALVAVARMMALPYRSDTGTSED